ncbi:MAG: chemotaxis protein CheW [Desulfobulbaceae bacterium]|nr:chemotaxis protein CheW [Pseudomonadota bacterium]MCG2747179.1 chemotaxis protein CheW [Desulfobulbaceae bacterium]
MTGEAIKLRRKFCIAGTIPDIEQVVITELNGTRVGFVVDCVIGEHQTVIKSLGPAFKQVEDVSGATILDDGSVALILDIPQLVRSVEEESRPKNIHALHGAMNSSRCENFTLNGGQKDESK